MKKTFTKKKKKDEKFEKPYPYPTVTCINNSIKKKKLILTEGKRMWKKYSKKEKT